MLHAARRRRAAQREPRRGKTPGHVPPPRPSYKAARSVPARTVATRRRPDRLRGTRCPRDMSCHRVCFLALGEWWPRVGESAPGSAPLRTLAVPSGGVRRGSAGGAAAPGCLREFTGTQRGQGTPLSASFLVAALVLATSSSYAASVSRSTRKTSCWIPRIGASLALSLPFLLVFYLFIYF